MNIKLRDYQTAGVNEIRARFRAGDRNVLYQLATGGGKTIVFSYITEGAAKKGNRVLILVHRQELIRQTSASLTEIGVPHGIIAPGYTPSWDHVQVASVQTLVNRMDKIHIPNLIIVDECHHAIKSTQWGKVLTRYDKSHVLGVSATPARLSGEGLGVEAGGFFESMVSGPAMSELIERGYLSRPRVFAPPIGADFSSLKMRMGDFVQGEVEELMDKPVITGCAVEHYRKLCDGVPAIAFCASVRHAEHVAEQFRAAGYRSASIDGTMQSQERKQKISDLGNGGIQILTSCQIISEGTDIPIVSAAILLRPTASLTLFLQQCGRALRPFPGKEYATILDHVGNVRRHGMIDDNRTWDLNGERTRKKKKEDDPDIKTTQCEECYAVFTPAPACPFCGHVRQVSARELQQMAGELEEITRKQGEEAQKLHEMMFKKREEGKASTLADFQAIAKERGYNPGWAYHRMKSREQRGGARV